MSSATNNRIAESLDWMIRTLEFQWQEAESLDCDSPEMSEAKALVNLLQTGQIDCNEVKP